VIVGYGAYLAYSLLILPLSVMLYFALKGRGASPLLAVAAAVGVISALARALGIGRWLFLMPFLAEIYGDPSSSPAAREAVEVAYVAFNEYAGGVGELLGVAGGDTAAEAVQRSGLTIRRAGNRVVVAGQVDLTTAGSDRADFQLKISFPGQVVDTDGDADAGTVSWVFEPGEVGGVEAVVAFDDPRAPSPLNWTLGLAAVVGLASAAVVLLARRTRNPPVGSTR